MKNKIPLIMVVAVLLGVAIFVWFRLTQTANRPQVQASNTPPAVIDLNMVRTNAEAGDAAAQTQLGQIYLDGRIMKPDVKEAKKWFQRAADQDYPDALATLGELTQAGQGLPRNLDEAVRLYRRAAEKGSVAGQYNLAYSYEQGTGVKQNEAEAAKWYQLAAEGGDPIAQYDIGQRYKIGIGVSTNRVQAFKWLTLAANQGQSDSTKLLRDLKGEMSDEEMTEANGLVKTFTVRGKKLPSDQTGG